MKKPKALLLINFCIIIFLSLMQVIISNSLSTKGLGLSSIENEKEAYKKRNSLLQEKLLSISSLAYIATEAASIGFVNDKSTIFISSSFPIARKQ